MISSVKDYIIAGLAVALLAGAIAGVVLNAKLSAAKSNLEVSQMRETRLQEEVGKATLIIKRQTEEIVTQNAASARPTSWRCAASPERTCHEP